jgi:hypothetical protein
VADEWLDALRIPTLAWVHPLLPSLGLPSGLVDKRQALRSTHAQAVQELSALRDAVAEVESFPGLDGAVTRELIIRAMHRLGALVGVDNAVAFERWARTQLVSHDAVVTLFAWRIALLRYLRAPTDLADTPPAALARSREQLDLLLSEERGRQLDELLRKHAPSPSEDERAIGLDQNADALRVKEIVWNRWTIEALGLLADALDDAECDQVAEWAARQMPPIANAPSLKQLRRLLEPEKLFADAQPAVLLPIPAAAPGELQDLR